MRCSVNKYKSSHYNAIKTCSNISHRSFYQNNNQYILRNFHQFSTKIKSQQETLYQSLKDEYASSPFRSTSGTSIDPLFDPDSIAHPEMDDKTTRKRLKSREINKTKLQNALIKAKESELEVIETRTEDDIEDHLDATDITQSMDETNKLSSNFNINNQINNNFNDNKSLQQSRIIPGWKKRINKIEKYRDRIIDPLNRPIIHKKRIFNKGDQCEGCGALLQNIDPNKIGYVDNIENHEKIINIKKINERNDVDKIGEIDGNMEMKDIYIPDHQRLLLMDLGIIGKNQKYLTYDQYMMIQEGNKRANNRKRQKIVLEKAICSRCFQLEHYKKIQRIKTNTIIPENFNDLLTKRFSRNKVNLQQICIIKIVDIFDFHGSFIANLHEIINGDNKDNKNDYFQNQNIIKKIPIILAINKIDLLTSNVRKPVNHDIIIDWTWNECQRFNFKPHSIIIICTKTGFNVDLLLETAIKSTPIRTSIKKHKDLRTEQRYRDIYIIGTTNVGKSTLLNQLLNKKLIYRTKTKTKYLTTSMIPATTLGIIPFMVTNAMNTRLLDTPGVINYNNLCLKLTDDEYKMLIPKKSIKPITYKIKKGQSIILGSLARLDCDDIYDEENNEENEENGENGQNYFYFTIFVAPQCSVHLTKIERVEEIIDIHSGSMLKPINDIERILNDPTLKMEKKQTWNLNGIGLQCAVCDVVFPQIGWIALIGTKKIKFTAHSIKDSKVGIRKPLLSRDMYRNVRKYQGIPHKKW